MTGNLDLKLRWGPFSPTYLGVSRILDEVHGSLLDLPLFVRRLEPFSIVLPDSAFDHVQNMQDGDRRAKVNAVPERVAPDYSSYGVRYFFDAEGDSALARFSVLNDRELHCDLTFSNRSREPRQYDFGLGVTVMDGRPKVRLKEELRKWWVPGRGYADIVAYQKAFAMGGGQCLSRVFNWSVEPEVLAQAFGGWAEDRVTYRAVLPRPLRDGFLYFRYVKYGELCPEWELRVNGKPHVFRFLQTWKIPGGGWGKNRDAYEEWRLLRVPLGAVSDTEIEVTLRPIDPPGNDLNRIWVDGLLFSEGMLEGDRGDLLLPTSLVDAPLRQDARVRPGSEDGNISRLEVLLPGESVRQVEVELDGAPARLQEGTGSILSHLRREAGMSPPRLSRDANIAPWTMVMGEAVAVPPASERTVSFRLRVEGTPELTGPEVTGPLPDFVGPFAEMASRLRDIVLFNINFPFRMLGQVSAYFVPAKYFPLPYSWDGGFAAVGMATFSPTLARKQVAYFLADAEQNFPLLYCGSPVPTPLYALWDWYQATQDVERLAGLYDGARRTYDFYLGRTPGSEVNAHQDGFLSTYAYNYNLGIDDHPIQRWAEECHLTSAGLYSIILMPQILRVAGIMRNIALLLGRDDDAAQFGRDAELLRANIDGRMWDEASGVDGWARRTERGVEPVVFEGCAGDRSACAFLPLFAGLTTHKDRLLEQMMDPARFRTPFGISSVDMQAPSYNPQGYWNGGIWPVLQWYLWRGLLEAGEPALARELADTILETWRHFHETEHYFGEHFMIAPGQMNGAPNFGGLNAALLPMCAAYYTPYHVTPQYDVVMLGKKVKEDMLSLTLTAPCLAASSHDLLLNMGKGGGRYAVSLDGQPHGQVEADRWGHFSLHLPRPIDRQAVTIKPVSSTETSTTERP